jgi:hypothetical protein
MHHGTVLEVGIVRKGDAVETARFKFLLRAFYGLKQMLDRAIID